MNYGPYYRNKRKERRRVAKLVVANIIWDSESLTPWIKGLPFSICCNCGTVEDIVDECSFCGDEEFRYAHVYTNDHNEDPPTFTLFRPVPKDYLHSEMIDDEVMRMVGEDIKGW